MAELTTNNVRITGILANAEVKKDYRKSNGAGYVAVNAIVKSVIGGKENEFPIEFFANATTADGQPSKLYETYGSLDSFIGQRITVTGNLIERRYWSNRKEGLTSICTIRGKFISIGLKADINDDATFDLGGFIVNSITERRNKNNEIYRYDIDLAQGNYKMDSMQKFTLNVDPNRMDILNGIKLYNVGDTVEFNGKLEFLVTTTTVADTNTAFGEPKVRTYTNRTYSYFIEGGTYVLKTPEQGCYNKQLINALVSSYKAKDVEIEREAKERGAGNSGAAIENTASVNFQQASLI